MPSPALLPLVGILVLVSAIALPSAALDPSGDGTGNLGVTVIDPTATESPTPAPSPATSGAPRPGGFSSPDEIPAPAESPNPEPASALEGGGWIVVSGVEASAHGEADPLGGWANASVRISNTSESATAGGSVTFRLFTPFGVQIGSKVTHTVTGIVPGDSQRVNARLDGVGQWPLLRVVATFTPGASESESESMEPISREAWILAFPWVLLVALVLLLATAIIVGLRRGSFAPPGGRP